MNNVEEVEVLLEVQVAKNVKSLVKRLPRLLEGPMIIQITSKIWHPNGTFYDSERDEHYFSLNMDLR